MQKYGRIDLDKIGRIKKEEFKTRGHMKEKSEQIILDIPVREFNVFEEKDEIMDTIKMMIDKSYLLDGGSGVGKSYYCVKLT